MPSRAALKMHDEIQEKKDEENNIFTKWRNLIIGHAYKILDVNRIKTVHGKATFFTLKKDKTLMRGFQNVLWMLKKC